jgi:hypothetical protein
MPFKSTTLFTALALSSLASSIPTSYQTNASYPDFVHPSNGICTDYTVTETLTYPEVQWTGPRFKDNHDVVGFLAALSRKGGLGADFPLGNTKNVTKTFDTAGTFCKPKGKNVNETTVLVATHGLGFDRR